MLLSLKWALSMTYSARSFSKNWPGHLHERLFQKKKSFPTSIKKPMGGAIAWGSWYFGMSRLTPSLILPLLKRVRAACHYLKLVPFTLRFRSHHSSAFMVQRPWKWCWKEGWVSLRAIIYCMLFDIFVPQDVSFARIPALTEAAQIYP